jgi:hypothetical protein
VLELIWKIIRGIHRWPEAEAWVTSVYRYTATARKGQSRSRVTVGFRYRTLDGRELRGTYVSDDCSAFYQMSEGDRFSLSYNPSRPESYWSDIYGLGFGDSSWLVALWVIGMVTILIVIFTSN